MTLHRYAYSLTDGLQATRLPSLCYGGQWTEAERSPDRIGE